MRNTAAGLRYVLYLFLSELERPWIVTHKPAGYFIAPMGEERVGDVSNVVFSNGWIERKNGDVLSTTLRRTRGCTWLPARSRSLLDYVLNTPADPLRSHACVAQRYSLIKDNLAVLEKTKASRSQARRQEDRQASKVKEEVSVYSLKSCPRELGVRGGWVAAGAASLDSGVLTVLSLLGAG